MSKGKPLGMISLVAYGGWRRVGVHDGFLKLLKVNFENRSECLQSF